LLWRGPYSQSFSRSDDLALLFPAQHAPRCDSDPLSERTLSGWLRFPTSRFGSHVTRSLPRLLPAFGARHSQVNASATLRMRISSRLPAHSRSCPCLSWFASSNMNIVAIQQAHMRCRIFSWHWQGGALFVAVQGRNDLPQNTLISHFPRNLWQLAFVASLVAVTVM